MRRYPTHREMFSLLSFYELVRWFFSALGFTESPSYVNISLNVVMQHAPGYFSTSKESISWQEVFSTSQVLPFWWLRLLPRMCERCNWNRLQPSCHQSLIAGIEWYSNLMGSPNCKSPINRRYDNWRRQRSTPEMFEAFMLLRINTRLWDLLLGRDAFGYVK